MIAAVEASKRVGNGENFSDPPLPIVEARHTPPKSHGDVLSVGGVADNLRLNEYDELFTLAAIGRIRQGVAEYRNIDHAWNAGLFFAYLLTNQAGE